MGVRTPVVDGVTIPGVSTFHLMVSSGGASKGRFLGVGEALANTVMDGAGLTSYRTRAGAQTLISVTSAQAAHSYTFRFPAGVRLIKNSDGSVTVRDRREQSCHILGREAVGHADRS